MTQENRSPREELLQAIAGVFRAGGPVDPDFADELTDAVLDAIKEAGGIVLMPRDANAKRAWGEITEIPGAYVNVLEADPSCAQNHQTPQKR